MLHEHANHFFIKGMLSSTQVKLDQLHLCRQLLLKIMSPYALVCKTSKNYVQSTGFTMEVYVGQGNALD